MTRIPGYETLNSQQYQIATEFSAPVFVAAGAGSGKTFALTKRILRAMQPGSAEGAEANTGKAVLSSLDQALVITFTEKAAAEIKDRVRSELLKNGFAEEALQVDTAWISTIHGMCSRILRDNALELGLDPEFKVLGANVCDELRTRAMDRAISRLHAQGMCAQLFAEFPLQHTDPEGREQPNSITSMVGKLMDAAASSCKGMDAVQPVALDAMAFNGLVATLEGALVELIAQQRACIAQKAKEPKVAAEALAAEEALLETVRKAAASDQEERCALVAGCLPTGKLNGNYFRKDHWNEDCKECGTAVNAVLKQAVFEAQLVGAGNLGEQLLAVAREAWSEYGRLKAAHGGMDNDDLLNATMAAFEADPQLARTCAAQFKLVMVDEFQDTNEQQVRIIDALTADNPAKLITVGDVQQSIYRFRGADVDVFARKQANADALQVRMAENYRSHDDVLRLVRHVCEGRQGVPSLLDGFMDLLAEQNDANAEVAARAKARHEKAYAKGQPRVVVEAAHGKAALARTSVADRIAERFDWLKQEGMPLGDMALLVATNSQVALYLDAFKRRNLDYVVSGGSNYSSLEEVKVMAALLRTFANPHDTESGLFRVLESDMFGLTLDDLCALAVQDDPDAGDALWKASLAHVFTDPQAQPPVAVGASARAQVACTVLRRAFQALGSMPVADVCRQVLVESGWLARLEGAGMQGMAQAANVLAAVDYIRTLASDMGLGAARTAIEFDRWLASAKTGPASLSGETTDAIRVMTIHASKGLQFPVVAVVECFKDPYSTTAINNSPLALARCGETIFASLRPDGAKAGRGEWPEVFEAFAEIDARDGAVGTADVTPEALMAHYGMQTNGQWHLMLKHLETKAEVAEVARLIYVALTRAQEALVLGLTSGSRPKPFIDDDPTRWAHGDTFDKVGYALFGADAKSWLTDACECEFDFGGEAPGVLRTLLVEAEADPAEAGEGDALDVQDDTLQLFDYEEAPLSIGLAQRANPDVYSFSYVHRVLDAESSQRETDDVAEVESLQARAEPADAPSADDEPDYPAVPPFDPDRATNFGSALHMCAQYLVESHTLADGAIDKERIEAIADACGLPPIAQACGDGKDRTDLLPALQRWLASEECKEALAYPALQAEAPFFVNAPSRFGDYLEGAIDLLAFDPDTKKALVVDYKTGYLNCTPEEYQAYHQMQARFYAYVLLDQGFEQVTCKFVAVQRDGDQPGKPLVASYGPFTKDSGLTIE